METKQIYLNQEQNDALEAMLLGRSAFITGNAGTGKSVLLGAFKATVDQAHTFFSGISKWRTAFLAPTGIAALNIGGCTIHSFFGLPTGPIPPGYVPDLYAEQEEVIRKADTIVIDEVSMVRSDVFAAVEGTCRKHHSKRGAGLPFGGKQIIVVGDFGQLPPVVTDYEHQGFLTQWYGGPYAFQTKAWADAGFANLILKIAHRQHDHRFLAALDGIRNGNANPWGRDLLAEIEWLNGKVRFGKELPEAVCLCTTRKNADAVNFVRDAELGGTPHVSTACVAGKFPEDMYPTDYSLAFRMGSRVMILANGVSGSASIAYANGDMGRVVGTDPEEQTVTIHLDRGPWVKVPPYVWLNQKYTVEQDATTGEHQLRTQIIGTFTQYPIKLAYAATIHKVQGLTIGRGHISLGRGAFAPGQAYTALSRVRSPCFLSMDRELRADDILPNPAVAAFDAHVRLNEYDPVNAMWPETYAPSFGFF